jgi:hypothetical protein
MNRNLPPVSKGINSNGIVEYQFWADPSWDGFESVIKYLQKYWSGEVAESSDEIYTRRRVVRCQNVFITVRHDSQIGNWFFRQDGNEDQALLEQIESDLIQRLSED